MNKLLSILLFSILSVPVINATSYGWGFSKNDNHLPPEIGKYSQLIENTDTYYVGNEKEKVVYLTMDAGYDNGNMEIILNVLKEKGIKATFFITGDFITRQSDLVVDICNEGHDVGNHTWSHKNVAKMSIMELDKELFKVEEAYTKLTGKTMTKYFRPPAGEFNRQALINANELGYTTVFWSLAYKDWDVNNQLGEKYSYDSVMNNLHNGAIILMHTVSHDNAMALGKIIDSIHKEGYTIKTLDYLKSSQNVNF